MSAHHRHSAAIHHALQKGPRFRQNTKLLPRREWNMEKPSHFALSLQSANVQRAEHQMIIMEPDHNLFVGAVLLL